MASTTTLNESDKSLSIDYSEYVRLATPGNNWKAQLSSVVRTKLSGTGLYYVRADGSDSNDGLADTAGRAWLTLQHAYTYIVNILDTSGQTIVVSVGPGTYAPLNVSKSWVGGGVINFIGDETTPSNVVISTSTASENCVLINIPLPAIFTISGFKYTSTGSGGSGIFHNGSGLLQVGAAEFGACTAAHYYLNGAGAQTVGYFANTITGAATYHVANLAPGAYFFQGAATTLSGTLSFSTFALGSHLSYSGFGGGYSGGTISGIRYQADTNAVINTNGGGANYFPGTVAGAVGTGGQYI
jgi:hypothetical protein